MEQYSVTGMSCAACSARVEKAVSKVPGVSECSVSLLTNSMGVTGTASPQDIIAAVEEAGYGASLKGEKAGAKTSGGTVSEYEEMLKDKETPVLRKRLIASLCLLLPLMYVSMGHSMWGWPLPSFFEGNHVAVGLLQLLFTVAVMVINQKFFYQRLPQPVPSGAQHGYPGGPGSHRFLRLQRVRPVCHDRGPARGRRRGG